MIAQERRQRIFEMVEASGIASVRDLQELEVQGLIRRVHGGAISVRGASYEPPFSARENDNAAAKQRIAAKAVEMINDGDSLILDVGTTTLQIARGLKGKRNLTVLVTNLRAAMELASQAAIQVIVIGGKLRASELSMVGHLAERILCDFQVDKAFIAVGGITIEHGLTEFNFDEAGTKRVMIERARQRIVVADHTKFGKVMLSSVAPLNTINTIITSTELDGEMATRLREAGIALVLA